jgi:hypothetical protein
VVEGGAQIASTAAGPGHGGDVTVKAGSAIVLSGPGPQITSPSTGSGNAGSVAVAASRLLMNDGAAVSTEAVASSASGVNIFLEVGDLLYLAVAAGRIVVDNSSIIAQTVSGNGGNIQIDSGEFVVSTDSIVSASSQLGILGSRGLT